MNIDLAQKAISSALNGNWEETVNLNRQILKSNPKDIDSLNRLARAYRELGDIEKAKKITLRVLKLDPYNKIALKSLSKWKSQATSMHFNNEDNETHSLKPEDFLEESGKTKLVSLMHLGDEKVISQLDAGDLVNISPHLHKVAITTQKGLYIGKLPDDLAARIKKLIRNGYQFQTLVKSAFINEVKVFIRELSRGRSFEDYPSFPSEKINYISFTPPELVHKKDNEVIGE